MVKKTLTLLTLATSLLLLKGCYLDDFKNVDEVTIGAISPSFAFPVVNSTITISDLLNAVGDNAFIKVSNDSIFIIFSDSLEYKLDLNTFKVPDKEFTTSLPVVPGMEFPYYEEYVTIQNGSEINYIDIKSGTLYVEFNRNFTQNFGMVLTIPSLTTPDHPNGVPLTPNWDGNPFSSRLSFDLTDARLKLSWPNAATNEIDYNTFAYAIGFDNSGNASGTLDVTIGFSNIQFNQIVGLINHEIDMPDQEIDLSTFSSIIDGEIYLKNPSIGFGIGTSFGVPSSFELSEIKFEDKNGEPLLLANESDELDDALLIGAKNYLPFANSTDTYQSKRFKLNGNNSNIEDLLPSGPSKMAMKGKFSLGDASEHVNPHEYYVKDTSSFNLDLGIELPLAGRISGLKFSYDLYDIELPEIDTIPMVSNFDYEIELILKTNNGIPLTFGLQVVFSDGGTVIDSLFNDVMVENIIQSPTIASDGKPSGLSEKITRIKMSKEKYERIRKANKLELQLQIDTGTEQNREVLIQASNQLSVQVAVRVDAEIKP